MSKKRISPADLYGQWLHAQEEDTDTEMIFRPADHPLPPARGRTGLELCADQTCNYLGIGRADRPEASEGSWQFDEQTGTLSIDLPDGTHQALAVGSVKKDKLILKKPS
jgi:hypothetical protein